MGGISPLSSLFGSSPYEHEFTWFTVTHSVHVETKQHSDFNGVSKGTLVTVSINMYICTVLRYKLVTVSINMYICTVHSVRYVEGPYTNKNSHPMVHNGTRYMWKNTTTLISTVLTTRHCG